MIRVPNIKVELVYRFHKSEWFHAMIDTESDVTIVSANSYPERYWKDLHKPLQVVVASGQVTRLTKVVFGQFIAIHDTQSGQSKIMPLPTIVIQAPKDATYNLVLGVDFLKRFEEYWSNHSQISFLTPRGHWIKSSILHTPTMRTSITFTPRSQHGGYPQKWSKNWSKRQKKPSQKSVTLLTALSNTQRALEFRLEEEVKSLLQANFDDNLLKYWDKDKSYADIQLKDARSIVRVKPMRYNQNDEQEFKIQLRELEEKQLAYKSIEDNKSPHSSPTFMVNNHSEQKRGKPRMIINYKRLNKLTVFDGYFLPNKELLINKTLNKKWFSKFDCKSSFYQIKLKESAKPLTAFSTPQGQYIWNVMPMGLKNAPQIFQRRLDNIFNDYADFCLVYVDDILIFSSNIADHAIHLMKFIEKVVTTG
ncbi:hypothetical protein Cgig2_011348 [Carnegiea gigantea]|uniref:RNA-directed DNA polymerase n=1 Tax=Carnegiea gigantea TaxID=171969 RepID=A0A9Q1KU77_9CARY|nr:hypothetical protein Cgig2_011348 [Carnegiea gigantea]